MFARLLTDRMHEALGDTPVVLVTGPRRAGKTTLVRQGVPEGRRYITLDDATILAAAQADPVGFIRDLDRVTLDEIQRVPDLLLAIKKSVDEDYRPGRFLLTGSANILTLPRVADSLAGRMESMCLLPLAQAEIGKCRPTFLDRLFRRSLATPHDPLASRDLVSRVLAGGFPEALGRSSDRRRQDWGRAYLSAILTRDLRDIAVVEKLTELPKFVRLLAEHSGKPINAVQLGAGVNLSSKTAQRYIGLLEQIFLIVTLPPWHTNMVKRLVKTPKLHFIDSGLLATILGLTAERIAQDRTGFGAVLESFVLSEILKLMAASDLHVTPYHFRDHGGHEVDIVLERDDGQIAGIEIKAAATVGPRDFTGLRLLADACGDRFAQGVVLYDGSECVPFGPDLTAAPLGCLWS